MTEHSPITPPTALIKEWMNEFYAVPPTPGELTLLIATRAAEWGADQELEACVEWMASPQSELVGRGPADLRIARRPKPPSLKKQALEALDDVVKMSDYDPPEGICSDQADIIRRALEALPDDL